MKRMEKTRGPHHDSRGEIRMLIETESATRNPAGALLNETRITDPPTGSLEGGAAKHSMYTGHKILHSLLGESLHTHAGLLTFLAYVPSMGELVIRIGIYTDTADVHV